MFEPMGGSAPKYAGQDVINPMAAIGAAMMMLDSLGETKSSQAVENAMIATMKNMKSQRQQDGHVDLRGRDMVAGLV